MGLSPWYSEGFFSQCRLPYSVHTAPVCSRMHQHLRVHEKSPTLAAIPLFGHTDNTIHTDTVIGMGSAALVAAVPYPAKVAEISCSGQ